MWHVYRSVRAKMVIETNEFSLSVKNWFQIYSNSTFLIVENSKKVQIQTISYIY